ncbi:37S ribosomal protein S9 [Pleodorina starrii]|nr:37S ribosomal protein S9 [Pleodorina starrii]
MMQGLGALGAASLGPSSLAAASALTAAGLCRTGSFWPHGFSWTSERALATEASAESAPTAGPSRLTQASTTVRNVSASSNSSSPDKKLPLLFSLRPSVLSPLYSTWDQTRKMAHRREQLTALLKSHVLLSSSFRAKNDADLARKVRQRAQQIHQVSILLGQMLDDPAQNATVPRCPSPAHATAYCAALEELTLAKDAAAHDFARVQRGEASPWEHYSQHFVEPYQNTPRLEPLEVIFSKPDPAELVRQLYKPAAAAAGSAKAAAAVDAAAASQQQQQQPLRGGPHIDVAGVTHTAGKRKASSATLDLVPGSGQITVNGLPIASYFRETGFRQHALQPLMLTGTESKYDISVRARRGFTWVKR